MTKQATKTNRSTSSKQISQHPFEKQRSMNLEAKSPFFDPKLQHGLYIHAHSTAQLAENESGSTRTMSLMATVPRLYSEPSDRVRADSPRLESSWSLDPLGQLWRRLERLITENKSSNKSGKTGVSSVSRFVVSKNVHKKMKRKTHSNCNVLGDLGDQSSCPSSQARQLR